MARRPAGPDEDVPACRLYLITPPAFEPAVFAETLREALDADDVACVQLRLKGAADDEVRRAADVLRPACHERDVALLINDRPDLAAATGADGVHIGQEDADVAAARAAVGADGIVGVTCHDSLHLAMEAGEAGADYVAFGAFYGSTSKEPATRATPELLRRWSEATVIPCVAIGGITPANCRPLVVAGADFLAVIGAVWEHREGPAAAVAAFTAAIEEALAERD